jgi:YVTN family beta-propeller protein
LPDLHLSPIRLTDTVDTTTISGFIGTTKWNGGVLAPNGKIYGIPDSDNRIIMIDPKTNKIDTINLSNSLNLENKWNGGVLASNGKIYGISRHSESVLIIDPETNTVDTITITGLIGTQKWIGGVLAPNGKIYGIPRNSESFLIINTSGFPKHESWMLQAYYNKV